MIKTNSIPVVIRNFSVGLAFKFMLAFTLLALLLGYCWNRVQRLTGASANAGATGVGQHINSGSANSNSGTPSGQIASAVNSNGVSAASLNNTVRSVSGIPGHGRYQKNLVTLNKSSVLGEQDERVKLSILCKSGLRRLEKFKPLWDSRREAYVTFAPDKKFIVWNAEAPARATAQLHEPINGSSRA